MRRPNLFLIGAMKSGTTYLRKLLNLHPAVFMCDPDEPSYFVDPAELRSIWPEAWQSGLWRDENNYLRLFDRAGEAAFLGDASTIYTKRPAVQNVASRIKKFNPDSRLIYIMRDPAERTISHYWHMVRHHREWRPIVKAIREDPQFVAVSYYSMQLQPFLECFGRERIAILTYESLVRDPASVIGMLWRWLGLEQCALDLSALAAPENVTPDQIRAARLGGVPRRLWQAQPLRTVAKYTPDIVTNVLRRATTQVVTRQSVDLTEVYALLRPIQTHQTKELVALLEQGFPDWVTVDGQKHDRSSLQRRPVSVSEHAN
jgi:hypothetical protein